MPVAIALALAMALWVNGRIKGRAALRLAFFTPTILPMVAAANIWLFFYTPGYGLLDQIGRLFGFAGPNWLGEPATALPALMAVTVWKEAGFFMIFFLAALQQVPPDLYEAARMENAGRWQVFRRITWPLVMPTTLFVAINALINAFRIVDQVIAMTGGRRRPNNATIAAAVLHLSGRLQLLGHRLCGGLVDGAAARCSPPSRSAQFFLLDRRIHYR